MTAQHHKILAIETATPACSVALMAGETLISREQVGSNIHSQVLLDMIQEVLKEAGIAVGELHAIAVGQGPGSFTGLRIGVGVAQGLAYGAGCPMIGISSLDALAVQANTMGRVIAGIDARMGEIYWCDYQVDRAILNRKTALSLSSPMDLQAELSDGSGSSGGYLVGNAWAEYQDQLNELIQSYQQLPDVVFPNATGVLTLAKEKYQAQDWVSAIEFAPEYVRNNVAKKSVSRK